MVFDLVEKTKRMVVCVRVGLKNFASYVAAAGDVAAVAGGVWASDLCYSGDCAAECGIGIDLVCHCCSWCGEWESGR